MSPNLSSIVNGIYSYFASLDSNAVSQYEIDSRKELENLGGFLNGSRTVGGGKDGYSINDLKENDKNVLTQIYNNLMEKLSKGEIAETEISAEDSYIVWNPDDYGREEYMNVIKKINKDNVLDFDIHCIASLEKSSVLSEQDKQIVRNHIAEAVISKLEEVNYTPKGKYDEDLNLLKSLAKDVSSYNLSQLCSKLRSAMAEYAEDEEIKKVWDNSYDDNNTELQEYANRYIRENGVKRKNHLYFGIGRNYQDGDLYKKSPGDGSYNDATTQGTANCWLMGGINSMGAHDKSREYMNSLVYSDSMHGVYVVKIPEAAEKGFGEDGKGIYIITFEELDHTLNIVDGDYDIAAYNLAVQKYFEETCEKGDNGDVLKGNSIERSYEIFRGMEAQEIKDGEIPNGVGVAEFVDHNAKTLAEFKEGTKSFHEEKSKLYDALIKHFEGGGGILMSVSTEVGGHALSVVGVKNGMFVMEESSNSENFAKGFSEYWQTSNGTWQFLLDKETFINEVLSVATNKFE